MSSIKLKTLLNERFLESSERPKLSKSDKQRMMEMIAGYGKLGERVYRSGDLKELTKQLRQLIESVNTLTMNEIEGFDGITVNRHMKGLQNSYKLFEKTASEISILQERLEHLYEDIGSVVNKYFDIVDNGKMDNSIDITKS